MRLNLGCGNDIKEGYTNVDCRQTHQSVIVVDLSVLPWPFEDQSADEILMLDFLEHFPYAQTKQILMECYRVLRSDGELVIQVPDGVVLSQALAQRGEYPCNNCGTKMYGLEHDRWVEKCPKCGQDDDDISEAAMKRIFGGQDYPGNFHMTCFTPDSLSLKARSCGLYWNRYEEEHHQHLNWNFKSVFRKGDIW